MTAVVAIGDERRLAGYALAGATVVPAASPAAIDAAWQSLDEKTVLLVLSPDAHVRLDRRLADRTDLIWVVLPS